MQPSLTSDNTTNTTTNDNNNETDEIVNPRLLNILNWSPLENLVPNPTTVPINDENEPKSKNGYNAVQISIELQKKMLK
jgi:hypothetical protein